MLFKAITIHQPHAVAIACGEKRVENRPRPCHYRGALIVHAAKSQRTFETALRDDDPAARFAYENQSQTPIYYGAFIGVVRVYGSIERDAFCERFPEQAKYASGQWCWLLDRAVLLREPIPFKGERQMFNPEIGGMDELQDAIRRVLDGPSTGGCRSD